jgi:hypothetical protein
MKFLRLSLFFSAFSLLFANLGYAQGMPLDSVRNRLALELKIDDAPRQLRSIVENYDRLRVWGLAIGDFSNDRLPDLALSLYDLKGPKQQVKVYVFQNQDGKLVPMMVRNAAYFESPIEVGLTIDNSTISIIQKTGENQWFQEGYTIQFGDIILVERFDTESQPIQGAKGAQVKNFGRQVSRNYETLFTREAYFGGATGEQILNAEYYTFPAYNRLRSVYPGYGNWMMDTSRAFILQGQSLRRNASDLSVEHGIAAYDDEYVYVSMSINDDYLAGGNSSLESNDRITFWFDTYLKGDRRIKSRKGGTLTFRNTMDSFVYSVTVPLSALPGQLDRITHTSVAPLNSAQRDAANQIKAQFEHDTAGGALTGYTIKVRIPWGFFGFDMNPVSLYETRAPQVAGQSETETREESPVFGFTALIHDIDDPNRPQELTVQGTSQFRTGDPSSFGSLDLKPSTQFYGRVFSTYMEGLKQGLVDAGF